MDGVARRPNQAATAFEEKIKKRRHVATPAATSTRDPAHLWCAEIHQSQIRRSIVHVLDFCQFFTGRRQRGIGRNRCFPANDRGGFDTGTKLPLPLPSSGYRCTGMGG
jgi:hypothetical protein